MPIEGASEHAEEQEQTQDRDLPSAEIGDAVFGCYRLAGGRACYCRRVERRSANPRLEKDLEGSCAGRAD